MTIKEVEQITGLSRSNIYFYEKEKLVHPVRNENNGYREYSDSDIREIKKIAYLRTLGITIEDIRRISDKKVDLLEVIREQSDKLEQQISDLEYARLLCEKMLLSGETVNYEDLEIETYITDTKDYLTRNRAVFRFDSISFIILWGRSITWGLLILACFMVAILSYGRLPAEIPIQWSGDIVSSVVDKKYIFAFPFACILIRYVLRPFIWRWLKINIMISDFITDYITNYLCFIALSVEIFIIFYVLGILKHVTVILFVDTFVLIGVLGVAFHKLSGIMQE